MRKAHDFPDGFGSDPSVIAGVGPPGRTHEAPESASDPQPARSGALKAAAGHGHVFEASAARRPPLLLAEFPPASRIRSAPSVGERRGLVLLTSALVGLILAAGVYFLDYL